MKWITLTNNDYKLFNEEVDLGQNEFMQENLGAWEQMFREQGQPFWLHFLICYRSFILNCGFANNPEIVYCRVYFPLCKSKLRRLIDDVSIVIHKEFVEASFNEVRKIFNNIVIVVKNRHLIPHLGSRCREKDPLYHGDTKNAYRDLFYEAGNAATAWKVAVGLPFYLKFAGAICSVFKKWIQEKTLSDEELNDASKSSYWTIPPEWHDEDFKPGVFEQHLSKFWGKKLIEVLNTDMYEKFSQKLNCDPCYLDVLTCECENSYIYGTDDITETASTGKVAHKPSGSCRIRSDLLPSEITNTIAQAQKVYDAKERLRKKLGKKLRNKGEESSTMSDDCVADSDWRLKLLEKAEKQFKKESKITQKKAENMKTDGEKQDRISTKIKQLELKEHSGVSVKVCTDITDGQVSVTLSAGKCSQKQTRSKAKRFLDKTKAVEEKKSTEGKGDQANTTISTVKIERSIKQTNDVKDQIPKASNSSSGKDELTKDLEDIHENLDNIEKSIKETGGFDFEEFKLLLETGRLLMKGNNKPLDNESSQRGKNKSSNIEPQTVATKFHVCAQCMKKECAPKMFKKCSRCKLEKFTTPRYYCSKKCQVEDWEESHRDEHLRASTHKV